MKKTNISLCAAAIAIGGVIAPSATTAGAAGPAMRITKLTAKPRTVRKSGLISFTVTVRGIKLNFKDIGKAAVPGEGHVQYYLDHVPKDAWTRRDVHHTFLAAAGTPVAIMRFSHMAIKVSPGRHKILAALARNDDILYHAPVASVTIQVKR